MKELITATASLMLLLIFVLQFAESQNVHTKMFQSEMAIESFREPGGEQGYFTEENKELLAETLSDICACGRDEIQIDAENVTEPQPEGTLLSYRIAYPLKDLVAAPFFLGIAEEENQVLQEQKGWIISRFYRAETKENGYGNTDQQPQPENKRKEKTE